MQKKGTSMMFFLMFAMLLVTKLLANKQHTLTNFNTNLTSEQMSHLHAYSTCTQSCEIQARRDNVREFNGNMGSANRLTAENKRDYDQSFPSAMGYKQCQMRCRSNFEE